MTWKTPISVASKMGMPLLSEAFQSGGPSTDTQGFTDIGDAPIEMTQSEPQALNTITTYLTPTPPSTARPSTF